MYQKAVTFSYDDGIEQDRRLVEIFNRYGMKCTFNLNTGIQTQESQFEIEGVHIQRMNQKDIGDLYQGHEIALHGLTHAGPPELADEQFAKEFLQDAKNIERIYGKYPVGMAYAYGSYDQRVVDYLKSIGIKYGRTVGSTHGFDLPKEPMLLEATCHHNDEQLFALAKQFLEAEPEDGKPMLFYIWGHSYEFDVNRNWNRIERLCEMLAGHEDIFYGTNAECLLDNPFA